MLSKDLGSTPVFSGHLFLSGPRQNMESQNAGNMPCDTALTAQQKPPPPPPPPKKKMMLK